MGNPVFYHGAGGFQGRHHPHNPVKLTAIDNRIQVRAHHYCRSVLVGTGKSAPDVTTRANRDGGAKLIELVKHIVYRALIFRAKRQPGYTFAGRGIKSVNVFNIPADSLYIDGHDVKSIKKL